MERRRPLASAIAWIFVLRPPRERPIACFCSPFSARSRAVCLDVRGIDHLRIGRSAAVRKRAEQVLPYTAPRPPHKAIVNRRRRAVLRRAIAPPAAALQHMQDAADHAAIIHAILAAYVRRQMRLDPSPLLVVQPKQVASHDLRSPPAENHCPIQPSSVLLSFDPRSRTYKLASRAGSECR